MNDTANTSQENQSEGSFNEADSKADTIAAFCLIMVAAAAMIYLAS